MIITKKLIKVFEAPHANCYCLVLEWEGKGTTVLVSNKPLIFDNELLRQSFVEVEEIELRGETDLASVMYKPDFPSVILVNEYESVFISKVVKEEYNVRRKEVKR